MKKIKVVLISLLLLLSLVVETDNSVSAASNQVSLTMSNGASYYGEVKNGKPNGKGIMKWNANKRYVGDWVDGKRNGQGTYFYTKGDKQFTFTYTGSWKDDKKNGMGTYVHVEDSSAFLYAGKGNFINDVFVTGTEVRQRVGRYEFIHMDKQSYASAQVYTMDIVPPTDVQTARKEIEAAFKVIGSSVGDTRKQHPTYTYLQKMSNGLYTGILMKNNYLDFTTQNDIFEGSLTMDLLDVQSEQNLKVTHNEGFQYSSRNDTLTPYTGSNTYFAKDYGDLEGSGVIKYQNATEVKREFFDSSSVYEAKVREASTQTAPKLRPYINNFAELLAFLAQNRYIHFQNKAEIPSP